MFWWLGRIFSPHSDFPALRRLSIIFEAVTAEVCRSSLVVRSSGTSSPSILHAAWTKAFAATMREMHEMQLVLLVKLPVDLLLLHPVAVGIAAATCAICS